MILSLAAIVAIFVVPKNVQWIAIVFAVLLIIASTSELLLQLRTEGAAVRRIIAAHPEATAQPTSLLVFDGVTRIDRLSVGVVLADRGGLSFRNRADVEVARVPADRILSLELAPHNPRVPLRSAVVATIDGSPVEFTVGAKPDDQAEAIVAIRTALGRPAG